MAKPINSFPGYEYTYIEKDKKWHNMYRNTDLGKGGYVYSEPGMHGNVALLDIQSMHPNSAVNLNIFGEHTPKFKELLDARIFIKHKEYDKAKKLFNGRLQPYLDDPEQASALAQALKIAINSVYGLTSAGFSNPFKDERNTNNIVALRGALFMRELQEEVQKRGYTVVHIKTDSIKIADATPVIIEFCEDFAKKYGYTFEHEATYERMCLINDTVYIARYKDGDKLGDWTATGTQFAVPYVFKTLFSKEKIEFPDLCQTFEVKQGDLYLDMNEELPDVTDLEKELKKTDDEKRIAELETDIAKGHDLRFVGRVGSFCPVKDGSGGGILYRRKEGKNFAATGSKGFRWLEAEEAIEEKKENSINLQFYNGLVDKAVEIISKYTDFEWFVSDEPYEEDLPF